MRHRSIETPLCLCRPFFSSRISLNLLLLESVSDIAVIGVVTCDPVSVFIAER